MKTKLPNKIMTQEQAEAFLKELHDNHELWNPDEDAMNVCNFMTDKPIFTEREALRLNSLMWQVKRVPGFDAKYYCLTLITLTMQL